jgi:hypothetical protein
MNCARARFLLYAHLDREPSGLEAEALSRHLAVCRPCAARGESARHLPVLLRSRLGRTPAPVALRARLRGGCFEPHRPPRYPLYALAASLLLLMVLPLASDEPRPRPRPEGAAAGAPSPGETAQRVAVLPVSRRLSGTFVCLDCESRAEAGLGPVPEGAHQAGFCADNGEVWRLMVRDAEAARETVGRTATIEGVAFPQSGFIRVSRVGY